MSECIGNTLNYLSEFIIHVVLENLFREKSRQVDHMVGAAIKGNTVTQTAEMCTCVFSRCEEIACLLIFCLKLISTLLGPIGFGKSISSASFDVVTWS